MKNIYESVPEFIRLTDAEVLFLALLRNISKRLPPDLLGSTRFPEQAIDEAIVERQLSHDGMLAAAYFGFMPFWSTFTSFQAHAKRINSYREHPDWEVLAEDEVARENAAAAQYQMSRGEVKRLFKALNEKAKNAGFASFGDVFGPPQPEYLSSSDTGLAYGPRYLRDIAAVAQGRNHPDFFLRTSGRWVLMLYREDENVFAMAFPIAGLRIGGYRFNGYLDEVLMEWSWDSEAPVFDTPEETLTELRTLAQLHCPDHEYVEQEAPSALDAWQTWILTESAFSREA